MLFRSVVPSPKNALSAQQSLQLIKIFMENASSVADHDLALVLCHHAEAALSEAKSVVKKASTSSDPRERAARGKLATAYFDLGKLLEKQGYQDEAQAFYKKSEKWGGPVREPNPQSQPNPQTQASPSNEGTTKGASPSTPEMQVVIASSSQPKQAFDTATVALNIFVGNVRLPAGAFKAPENDERLDDTQQLACCLGLLQATTSLDEILDPTVRDWVENIKSDSDEQERLKTMATDVIRAFKRDELKDSKAVTEVVYLAPVLEKGDFEYLLKEFFSGIEQSSLLDVNQLEGLAQLVQSADPGHLEPDHLVKILQLLSSRLQETHDQSPNHVYKLTLTVSNVLDAMADAEVKGLNREKLHEPLLNYLDGLKGKSDAYLVYQAAYAFQALLCVPDDESSWQKFLRRSGKVIKGVSGLVSAVKGLDLNGFMEGLGDIQQGLAGAAEVFELVKNAYEGATSLAEGGQGFLDGLKEGLSFSQKRAWYTALRGADALIREGQLAKFRKLVCEAPCRRDPAFQWGVCQRLGELAGDTTWDSETRRSAISFLGEIYRNDAEWGQQPTIKQWILNILMQLSSISMDEVQFVDSTLQELGNSGDATKQALYRACREEGAGSQPLKITLPSIATPSLLDRVQERLDVEGAIRQLRKQRLKERGSAVYIPPQAKANLEAPDDSTFPLMETVQSSLDKKDVFLVLGDSGSGKSTFNRELECKLWQLYKKGGRIPLHINLPAIDKPEHDMIAKQLRKHEFTEPQIREVKQRRKFILICDGYDESQQTHNLYTSNRLNETGEWQAKMVISCRSEYVGADYRDRFQPGDRNHRSEVSLLEEAVITPFSLEQVQDYIDDYVAVHRPLWEAREYKDALDRIPSLKELVKNPFLMSLTLEVLPRIVDPTQNLASTHITRVALYDQFVEHWLERGKRRLGEKNLSPQARAAFESLSDEGFTQNGIDFLKRLSVAIYKEQGGQPIVRYSRYKDGGSWKAEFFSREDERQLLREACPLIRSGNQHRFIHRSLLEYGLALSVFDPADLKERKAPQSVQARRGSVSSDMSFIVLDNIEEEAATAELKPDPTSPLALRSYVNEHSVLQFLEERVQQEPLFKKLLLNYIELSKENKMWRIAAANAITILVRAGMQFNHTDLDGIKIPGSDLSYGVFEGAQFKGADMRNVNLRGVWLQQADLGKARMKGAQFGELPYLPLKKAKASAFSPDGKVFAVGLESGEIALYSTSTWEKREVKEHKNAVWSLAFSPKGDQLVSGGLDKVVRLWNAEEGKCSHSLSGHKSPVTCVLYSPHGDQVASASNDKTVRLWNTETGELIGPLEGHTHKVLCIVYSPDGKQLASGGGDSTVRLWDIESRRCTSTLTGHSDLIKSVAYSPQGKQLASASNDYTVRLWDLETGGSRVLAGHSDLVYCATYSPKGDRLASVSKGELRIWDVETGSCLHNPSDHRGPVTKVLYSPRDDQIATASDDGTVRLWDPETGVCRQTLSGHSDSVTNILYSPKGDQIASIGSDDTVRMWDIKTAASRHSSSGHSGEVWCVKYSPRGDQVASCSKDNTIRLWDVETGACRHNLADHIDEVNYVAYSPNGDMLASASNDYKVKLWNVDSGECRTLHDHTELVNQVVFSPDGSQLASCSKDYSVRLWNVKDGASVPLLGHTDNVRSVVYSPQGDQVATTSEDNTARLWDVETGRCLHELTGHTKMVWLAVFSPNSRQLATASKDRTVKLWDVKTGECLHNLTDHQGEVNTVAYSPQGHQLASSCDDETVRIWDVETGACTHILTGHTNLVLRAIYSPDGDLIASSGEDMTVRIWDAATGQCHVEIKDFLSGVVDIAWSTSSDVIHLVASAKDGTVGMWQVKKDGDRCSVRLQWRTTTGGLRVKDTSVQDTVGLSPLNGALLSQRGATGKPMSRLREAGKKVIGMASLASRLKSASKVLTEGPPPDTNVASTSVEQQPEQQVDEEEEPATLEGFGLY